MRTTITIDLPLMKKIREIVHREHKTFKQVLQELLSLGVSARSRREQSASPFRHWHSKEMGALIDYTDKESLYKVLDQHP